MDWNTIVAQVLIAAIGAAAPILAVLRVQRSLAADIQSVHVIVNARLTEALNKIEAMKIKEAIAEGRKAAEG